MNTIVRTLDVPGATLHYEVRGTGPVLLLICGGIYDAAGFAGLAELLADRYTVVTYDRRGNSRSPLGGPPEPQRIDVHADDASRLLAEVADGPAFVFGNSSGAQIGLDLVARHPERVRALVAHEPPLLRLLDAGYWEPALAEVERAFREDGAGAAMGTFGAAMGMTGGDADPDRDADGEPGGGAEPTPEMLEVMARFEANTGFFVGYEVPNFGRWMPDLDALRGSSARIVLAVGEESVVEPPHRATRALAERLGTKAETYPGDHGGFGPAAEAFATRLDEVFSTS